MYPHPMVYEQVLETHSGVDAIAVAVNWLKGEGIELYDAAALQYLARERRGRIPNWRSSQPAPLAYKSSTICLTYCNGFISS